MNRVTHPLSSADTSIFSQEISIFCYIKECRHRFYFDTQFQILSIFLESKDWLSKYGYNFDDVSKNGYASLLKVKQFWNNSYDVIIFLHYVTNKILPRDSNYIVDWSCDQSLVTSISDRSYHNFNFIRISPEKSLFLRGSLGSSSII